ncbi:MAG TPA: L,D-transpeptidase family protein [Kiritimatiellia bacterium]|nr:L,D-transpeptidase family protein [Kiritimatiellia bacterium]HNR94716.1 L,D-transpeptidase family protein [Kiritimatiellia bacterium]HNS81074.1 L,D-transpeptidase family protein [Kiritimatiellia bacterium]HPA78634.1 L,D-transpeptidase family protein [Kiritimatiellia bacterium]HQQ04839.1 L,D-transpeptidase family protein [Kiritimatiellia bacterium]
MTDIYIRRNRENRGCFRLAVLAGIVAAGLLIWGIMTWRANRPPRPPKPEQTEEQVFEERAAQAASPQAQPEAVARRETPPAPAPAGDRRGAVLLAEARKAQQDDDLLGARTRALALLAQSDNPGIISAAEQILNSVNIALATTPRPMPEKTEYTIKRGDTISGLAKKFKTTTQLIQKSNGIKGHVIRAGDLLRILSGEFAITVSKSQNDLVLTFNGQFFKRYRVGTGKFGKTPTGKFVVSDKIVNPPWWRPDGKMVPYGDKENVLGTHWMALRSLDDPGLRGYGIHGTWEPETIGTQASAGCIRLANDQVEELFSLVPEGTSVLITE